MMGKMKSERQCAVETPLAVQINFLLQSLNSGSVDDVKATAQEFIQRCEHVPFNDNEITLVTTLLNSLATFGLVPSITEAEEREIDEKDFPRVGDKAMIVCGCIKVILSHVEAMHYKHSLVPLMIFCSQYRKTHPWSHLESVQQSKEVLGLLVLKQKCESVSHLLVAESESLLVKKIFQTIVPDLSRSSWKCNPGLKASFEWVLFHTKHPYVGEVFSEVLPPSLLFLDDFMLKNRLSGIACLDYILKNTPVAELQWYSRADVIYNALKNLIYHREPQIIISIYPCILKVLSLLEGDPKRPSEMRKVNRYDIIYQLLLKEMDMEQTIALRRAYSQNMHLFPSIMGVTILRHLKATLKILLQYLEVFDGPEETTRLNCLKALHALIIATWPRVGNYILIIVKGIIKLIYDISFNKSEPTSKDKIIKNSVACLKLLYDLEPDNINEMCRPLLNIVHQIPALAVINEIWIS